MFLLTESIHKALIVIPGLEDARLHNVVLFYSRKHSSYTNSSAAEPQQTGCQREHFIVIFFPMNKVYH